MSDLNGKVVSAISEAVQNLRVANDVLYTPHCSISASDEANEQWMRLHSHHRRHIIRMLTGLIKRPYDNFIDNPVHLEISRWSGFDFVVTPVDGVALTFLGNEKSAHWQILRVVPFVPCDDGPGDGPDDGPYNGGGQYGATAGNYSDVRDCSDGGRCYFTAAPGWIGGRGPRCNAIIDAIVVALTPVFENEFFNQYFEDDICGGLTIGPVIMAGEIIVKPRRGGVIGAPALSDISLDCFDIECGDKLLPN